MTRLAMFAAAMLLSVTAYAGAWGSGSFENDDALDWASECVKASSVAPVFAAFQATEAKYIEAPEGSRAVSAAEVVAAALGRPDPKLPPSLLSWSQRHADDLAQLAPRARAALGRVLDPKASELRQLWSEGKPNKWPDVIANLQSRLTK
jgi:hypothetical protein